MTARETEAWALKMMNLGWLKITSCLCVKKYCLHRRKFLVQKPNRHPKFGRYRFILGPSRSTIYRNRLVFIWHYRRLPQGNVDHKNLDKFDDRPENLRDMSVLESNRQGWDQQQARFLQEWEDWLDFMMEFDR